MIPYAGCLRLFCYLGHSNGSGETTSAAFLLAGIKGRIFFYKTVEYSVPVRVCVRVSGGGNECGKCRCWGVVWGCSLEEGGIVKGAVECYRIIVCELSGIGSGINLPALNLKSA